MEDRLNQIAERLRQVERELADPAVYSDQQRLKNLSREQKELTPVVETFTVLIPITSPLALISAPPELPELIAASVWIRFMVLLSTDTVLFTALTIP